MCVRGVGYDITVESKSKTKQYTDELNASCHSTLDLNKIKFSNESIRLTVRSTEQKSALLATKTLCGKDVEVIQPWSYDRLTLQQHANAAEEVGEANMTLAVDHLCVVYDVPPDFTPNEVADECKCIWAKRISLVDSNSDQKACRPILCFCLLRTPRLPTSLSPVISDCV